jgi:hypothetical protein
VQRVAELEKQVENLVTAHKSLEDTVLGAIEKPKTKE